MSSAGLACQAPAGSPSTQSSNATAPGTPASRSRHTSVVRPGRSGAIRATSGANAPPKIRQVQSKRSSRARFSAASLRGLTGHQTAPARAMPNTQEKATGSLADSTATLSPGWMPDRASACPITQDSCWTSA